MNAGILFFVVMIVGRVIVAIIRDGKREERERQEEAYNRQATTGNTTVISPLPVAQIRVDRDSVCMGDDATAPNAVLIDLLETDLFSDMVKKLCSICRLCPIPCGQLIPDKRLSHTLSRTTEKAFIRMNCARETGIAS